MTVPIAVIGQIRFGEVLKSAGVNLDGWGAGEAKHVADLFNEVMRGESFLRITTEGIARILRIVKMHITHPDRPGMVLDEDHQILPDGRRKERKQKPGGKIRSSETAAEALLREAYEELNLRQSDYTASFIEVTAEERASKSYPDLRSIYEVHHYRLELKAQVMIADGFRKREGDGTELFFIWKHEG